MGKQFYLLLAVLIWFVAGFVLADQSELDSFTTEDGSFTFDYPTDWFVVNVDGAGTYNTEILVYNLPLNERFGTTDSIQISISLPTKFYNLWYLTGETPAEMVAASLQQLSLFGQGVSTESTVDFATPSADGTPELLQLQANERDVTEFLVDGRPAAYGYSIMRAMPVGDASQLIIVADLGDDYWVTISVGLLEGGVEVIQRYETTILSIVQSMRYTPPEPIYSGNPDLPQVFSGQVGIRGRGSIQFFYPEDWFVSYQSIVLFSNIKGNLSNIAPEAGQFIGAIQGVSETIASVAPLEVFNECETLSRYWTAREVVTTLLGNLTPDQIEQMENQGVVLTQPEIVTINGVEIVYFRQYDETYERLAMYVDLGSGNVMLATVIALQGEIAQYESQIFAMASTFQYIPVACDDIETGD